MEGNKNVFLFSFQENQSTEEVTEIAHRNDGCRGGYKQR